MESQAVIMGGLFKKRKFTYNHNRQHLRFDEAYLNEKYFRPSKLKALNRNQFNFSFYDHHNQKDLKQLMLTPRDRIINYFSLLREAAAGFSANTTGGCGTIGMATLPYPSAYQFLSIEYQKKIKYENFLHSFQNIGHINLLKIKRVMNKVDEWRYFVEIETVEGSKKDVTYFAYYYGFVTMIRENDHYKINNLTFYGEDFLCAAYHGWDHSAEAVVDVKYGNWCNLVRKRYPTVKNGYVKSIFFIGKDGYDYLFTFFELTNGTDIEIGQYKKGENGEWVEVKIDPEKCLK